MGNWIKCGEVFPWQIANTNMRHIYQGCVVVSADKNRAGACVKVIDANTDKMAPEGILLFGGNNYVGSIINSTQDTRLIIELPREFEETGSGSNDYIYKRDLAVEGHFNVIAFRRSPNSAWQTKADSNMSIGPGLNYHDEGLSLDPQYIEIKIEVIGGPINVSSACSLLTH
jgi:hypothetical protein